MDSLAFLIPMMIYCFSIPLVGGPSRIKYVKVCAISVAGHGIAPVILTKLVYHVLVRLALLFYRMSTR